MLRGIDADKIQQQSKRELDEKYGGNVTSVEAARRGEVQAALGGSAAATVPPGSIASAEGFLASAPEV